MGKGRELLTLGKEQKFVEQRGKVVNKHTGRYQALLGGGIHNFARVVQVRKPHKCELCGGKIEKGEKAVLVQVQQWTGRIPIYEREYYGFCCVEIKAEPLRP